jgi:ubiquinone/menaquinone biosynthesis C-methylase UbiE
VSERLLEHYASFDEPGRLDRGGGLLEEARTRELLSRFLPAGASVLDVGGGDGRYAEWLARRGHAVSLVDVVPRHVDLARGRAGDPPLFEAELGDARTLRFADGSVDAAILFGPLYHLVERDDRLLALREARRVCRAGGVVCAAVISRLAPALDGILNGWIVDDFNFQTVQLQLEHGASGDPPAGLSGDQHVPRRGADRARSA